MNHGKPRKRKLCIGTLQARGFVIKSFYYLMKGVVSIYNRMLKEFQRLEEHIKKNENEINKLPAGKLVICADGRGGCKYFCSDGHTKTYIKKEDFACAEQLAYKNYLVQELEELKKEKRAVELYLKHHSKDIHKSNQLISESSKYQKLLSKFFIPIKQELQNWMNEPYDKNPNYPNQLIHKTLTGEYVRSKSEAFIYLSLHTKRIPFRYECALQLGTVTFHPDFTIRHPETGEIFYWENFGMMDNRDYAKHTYDKLDLYQLHGIIPGINLIATFETKEHPLGMDVIQKLIEHYFVEN